VKAEEVVPVLKRIMDLYPRFELRGRDQVEAWAEALGSVTQEEALSAVLKLSRVSEWPPTIRSIREHVARTRGILAPSAEEALPQMRAWLFYLDQAGYVNGSGYHPAKPRVHPAVREGAARMGGNWEDGFRFEWPKICTEYDNRILGGSDDRDDRSA
jgi:hypothetical protein